MTTTAKTNFTIGVVPSTTARINAYYDGVTGEFVFAMEDLTPFISEDNQNEFKSEDQ